MRALALGVPRAGRHLDPLELALERAALGGLRLLLELEPAFLLLQPARVVALPGDARAAVELQDPAGDVVEEVAVVRDRHDGARVLGQVPLEPGHRLGVEVVGGLVEEQQVGPLEEDLAERDAALLAAGDLRDVGVGRRQPQRVHRDLELPVELPGVGGLDRVLDPLVLGHELVALGLRELLGQLLVELLEALEQRAGLGDALLHVAEDVLGRVEPRVLRQEADRVPSAGNASPAKSFSTPAMIFRSVDLPAPFKPEDADLGARQEREIDALQNLALRRDDLPQIDHRVDVLVCHRAGESIRIGSRSQASGGASPTLIPIVPSRRFS